MPAYETPDPIHVIVELALGDLRVRASDRTDTVVRLQPKNPGSTIDRDAAAGARVEFAGGTLGVKTFTPGLIDSLFGRIGTVDVLVELPAGSSVDAVIHGLLRCEGRLGDCRLESGYGDIAADETGRLCARAGYGDIAVGRISGKADLDAGYGTIHAGSIAGPAVIKNTSGETAVDLVEDDLRVNTASGGITIGRALSNVTVKTANGHVRVDEVVSGVVQLETANGSIDVGVRQGSATWLDIDSTYGAVRMEMDPRTLTQAEDAVEVRARTGYGDIHIHRSTKELPHG
ncbi:DUF4097 family beta strand repeat-containing protein [Nonomuraea soli]|uniref:DUF4097 domain-containing protein n=1 Tax=Nonomuraea soli TaxID=1032476 RepID=A0A7W0CMW0_9ACTN|nr:DUF4097 family beta strand repeat-containing protein [Nonomuraea soli]MBA2894102.1 hypothetical protein [Nonomuraea soli]